jgi:hypothetical protein
MSRDQYRNLLKATFTDDSETVERLTAQLGEVPWRDSGLLVAAVFSLAVKGRFLSETNPDAVYEFVAEAHRDTAAASDPLDVELAEKVVRAALGEEELLDDVPPVAGMQVQIALTHKILTEAEQTPEQVDRILRKAQALLDQTG